MSQQLFWFEEVGSEGGAHDNDIILMKDTIVPSAERERGMHRHNTNEFVADLM